MTTQDRYKTFKRAADKIVRDAIQNGCSRTKRDPMMIGAADKVARLLDKTFKGVSDQERENCLKRYLKQVHSFSEFRVRLVCIAMIDPALKRLEETTSASQRHLGFQYLLSIFLDFHTVVSELSGCGWPLSKDEDADIRIARILTAYRKLSVAQRRDLFAWTLEAIDQKGLGDYWLLARFCERLALGELQVLANFVGNNGFDKYGNHTDPRPFKAIAHIAANA